MNITLDPKYEPLVREKLRSGEYRSAEDIISAAMQLLAERDEDRRALVRVNEGEMLPADKRFDARLEMLLRDSEGSGDATEMTSQDWEDIRRDGLAIIKARKPA